MKRRKTKNVLRKSASIFLNKDHEKCIKCRFPFNTVSLDEIRSIKDRKWSKINKYWEIPLSLENAYKLKDWNYIFKEDLKTWANKEYHRKKNPMTKIKIKGLGGVLMPFQREGVIRTENFNGNALIADEMGLGKTVQALAWCQLHKKRKPIVIVCPASLKLNWERETLKWLKKPTTQILYGRKPDPDIIGNVIIINYEILFNKETQAISKKGEYMYHRNGKQKMVDIPYTGWVDYITDLNPQVLIIDEGHYLMNPTVRRTKAVIRLAKNIPYKIGLTGTPIEDSPIQIYTLIKLINYSIFPDKWKFQNRYCNPKHNGFGWNFKGSSNVKELHDTLVDKVMIRRLKKDVLPELPDKMYSYVPLELDNKNTYDDAHEDFVQYIYDTTEIELRKTLIQIIKEDPECHPIEINDHKLKRLQEKKAEAATPLAQIEALKQLSVKGKLNSIIEWVENFLESGEKLVLFFEHLFVGKILMEKFGKIAVKIDGGTSTKKRDEAVQKFQNNPKIKLFIGNSAAEVGLTLTAASNVGIIEYPWTPGKLDQRIDRLHRISQKFTVWVHYFIGVETIDEKIVELLDKKRKVVAAILDGTKVDASELIMELINSYKY